MIVIGGCELSLERNPVAVVESFRIMEDRKIFHSILKNHLVVPVRAPTVSAFGSYLFLIGGC